jgi:hypothetical protein
MVCELVLPEVMDGTTYASATRELSTLIAPDRPIRHLKALP